MAPAAIGPAAIRFNSTSSTPTPVEVTPEASGSDQLTDLPDVFDITTIPERIGYLKELGLDFGWGSTSIMQYLIEHIHIYSGLPWWASIMAVGVLSRVVLFKAVMNASENAARMSEAKPKLDPLQAQMIAISREGGGMQAQQVVRAQMKEVHNEYGISTWKSLVPMLQIPLGFGCFRIVRGMASLPVPGLASETAGWLTDLTVADPFFILPAIAAGTLILTLKVSWYNSAKSTWMLTEDNRGVAIPVKCPCWLLMLEKPLCMVFLPSLSLSWPLCPVPFSYTSWQPVSSV